MGRHGQLITREFGPRVRISKVFTDLPLVPDSPVDLGIQQFCEKCELCSRHCPSNSIPAGARIDRAWDASNGPGMLKWPVKSMQCLDWWVKNGMHCSVCIRVCPWNKPNTLFHRMVKLLAERNIMTNALVYLDERCGYGKQMKPKSVPVAGTITSKLA
jgi:epoxyqueuosine reductase QueG